MMKASPGAADSAVWANKMARTRKDAGHLITFPTTCRVSGPLVASAYLPAGLVSRFSRMRAALPRRSRM
jgi:hypothetical protein